MAVSDAYREGNQHLAEGRFEQAIRLFSKAIADNTDVPESYNAMGVAYQKQNQSDKALSCFKKAMNAKADYGNAFFNAGLTYKSQGKYTEAVYHIRTAAERQPGQAYYHAVLGDVHQLMGHAEEAHNAYTAALNIDPAQAHALYGIGLMSMNRSDFKTAAEYFSKAYRVKPQWLELENNLAWCLQQIGSYSPAIDVLYEALSRYPNHAVLWRNLGESSQKYGDKETAHAAFRKAIILEPENDVNYYQMGNFHMSQGSYSDALTYYKEMLVCNPKSADAHNMVGNAQLKRGEYAKAIAAFRSAIQLKNDDPLFYSNMGLAHRNLGEYQDAIKAFKKAIEARKNHADAYSALGRVYLLQENFEEGWPLFEWRIHKPGYPGLQNITLPRWDGSPLNGKVIFVHAEQGYGDTMHFVRFLPELKNKGAGKVIFACDPALQKVLKNTPGIDEFCTQKTPPADAQCHIHLMSLPAMFKVNPHTVRPPVPYIQPDAALTAQWKERIQSQKRLKVGFAWQGRQNHPNDRNRSCPLNEFAELFSPFAENIEFFSLQHGPAVKDLTDYAGQVINLAPHLQDFSDTAATIANLDLIITVDTSVAHLAGAMGKPVWTLLSYDPDWRWFLKSETTPWYPDMRLFRQPKIGDWHSLFGQVSKALEKLIAKATSSNALAA